MAELAGEAVAAEAAIDEGGLGQPSAPEEGPAGPSGAPPARPEGGGADASHEENKPPRPSARALTITIVFVTLVAALGGFFLNRASVASSNAADTAQELSLKSTTARSSAYQQAESEYSRYLALQSLEAQASQEILEAASGPALAPTWAAAFRATEQQVAKTSGSLSTDLHPDLPDGDPDLNFPYDFYTQQASEGTYLDARSDAYNDVSAQWGRLVDSYTAILTIIAASLFLFGSAYVLYGRSRLIASSLATVMLAAAVAWGGSLAAVKEPAKPSAAAARDYTTGVVALARASTPAEFQPAISDFTAAIAARPDFAQAYSERATAEAERGSLQIGYGFIANVAPRWLRLAAADELKAYQLGDHDANQLLDVGWAQYQLWQLEGGHGLPPSSVVDFFRRAVALDSSDPTDLLDYALSLLARQHYVAAHQAFIVGLTHILFKCPGSVPLSQCTTRQPATTGNLQKAWVAGALETLGTLSSTAEAAGSPALRSQVKAAQGMVAASMAKGKVVGSAPGHLRISGVKGFLDPNLLGVDVSVPASVPVSQLASAPLTVLWYEQARGSSRWSAIPATMCWGHISNCGAYFAADHVFQFETQFLYADNSCFTDVNYRVALYVGSTLVAQQDLSPADDYVTTNLKPALDKGMNMGVCVPSAWHERAPLGISAKVDGTTVTGSLNGSEFGYQSPSGKRGVFVFRLYSPQASQAGTPAQSEEVVRKAVAYALSIVKARALPADLAQSKPYTLGQTWAGLPVSDEMAARFDSASTHTEAVVAGALLAWAGTGAASPASIDDGISAQVRVDHALVVMVVYGPKNSAMWSGARTSVGTEVYDSWSVLSYG